MGSGLRTTRGRWTSPERTIMWTAEDDPVFRPFSHGPGYMSVDAKGTHETVTALSGLGMPLDVVGEGPGREAMAAEAKISKADAKRALDAFVNNTTKALKKGDRVALVGFGTFSVSKRAARKGRNPQTGKEIKIAAKKVVKFKAGADLSKKVK